MAARSKRKHGLSAFSKTIVRSIRGSLGRFLAIMGIAALGCGFYAGLQMCGPDMRAAADALYDGTNLYDVRLVSTMGFERADVNRVNAVEGVQNTMPSTTVDVMARLGDEQVAVRMSSLDVESAEKSTQDGRYVVVSENDAYLNRVFLREGSWPHAANECVICDAETSGSVKVGDKIEVLYGATDVDDTLRERTFTVVGRANSSTYPYTGSFGSTTLGSGSISSYVFVAPVAFVEDLPYTEVFARVEGTNEHESGSEAYEGVVGTTKTVLEDKKDELAQARLDDVRADAQGEIDEARAEYEQKKADAQKELDDAQAELNKAQRELADGERELADGQRSYDEGAAELASSWQQLADARKTLDESAAKLEKSRSELKSGEASWQQGKSDLLAQLGLSANASLADARAQVEAQKAELEAGRAQLEEGIAQAAAGIEQAQAGIAQLEEGIAQLDAQIAALPDGEQKVALVAQRAALAEQLATAQAGLAQAQAQKQQLEQQLAALPTTDALDQALAGIGQLESTRATLDSAAKQIAAGEKELAAGEATYAAGKQKAIEGQAELDAAYRELQSGKSELADGRAAYEDGLATYESSRKEADEKLADAQKELDDAQKEVDDLEKPDVYVLDREQNEGVVTHESDSRRIDSIADVFPFIFFLVAALVSLTTMTRMVDDDRIEIGTYKALGYSTPRIASKYLCYAGAASIAGATFGILVLSQVLPFIVISSYATIYDIPMQAFPLPIDAGIALAAGGLGVGVTLLATYAAVVASLREVPATLMLPRAPANGKRILLERIGPIWRHLSFSWKVTCRNFFRYKRRLAMTVIGISGCTALILVGFGLHDAIWDIIDCQYGPIIHYNTTIGLNEEATEDDVQEVVSYLESTGEASDITRVNSKNMQANSEDGTIENLRVQVLVPKDVAQLCDAVTFRNRVTGEGLAFTQDSVFVTEKVSLKYGVDVGDTVVLYDQDDIGNAVGEGHRLTVSGVTENYVGNMLYVGQNAWKNIEDEEPIFSTIFASVPNEDACARIAQELHDFERVSTVAFSDENIQTYREMLQVVDLIVVVLIVSAGALAFIVLYNLTNINIGERVREIASLKVLGFTRREVYAYIFREIVLLALMGNVVGLVLGTYLETFVATTAEVDYVMFGRTIHPMSYVYSFAITMVFTVLILLLMRRKLDRVNMVESLKSVE